MERKKIDQNVILSGLKIIDSITDAKNVEKNCSKLINEAIKIFPTLHQFCKGNLKTFILLLRK